MFEAIDLSKDMPLRALRAIAKREPPLALMARRFSWITRFHHPSAPGFWCLGGEVPLSPSERRIHGRKALSATGTGSDFATALASLAGEAAELLSSFERKGDVAGAVPRPARSDRGWIAKAIAAQRSEKARIDGVKAFRLGMADSVILPADFCLRRSGKKRSLEAVGALSAGCAAGRTSEEAKLRAICELIERHAAALWWLGGKPASLASPRSRVASLVKSTIGELGHEGQFTDVKLLHLSPDLPIPVVAAVMINRNGRNFACGLAARPSLRQAVRAAIFEMHQMQVAANIASAKRQRLGEQALNDADRRSLSRAETDFSSCPMLRPAAKVARIRADPLPSAPITETLRQLIPRIERRFGPCYFVDLTRESIGIPVFRAVCSHLQPFSRSVATDEFESIAPSADFESHWPKLF